MKISDAFTALPYRSTNGGVSRAETPRIPNRKKTLTDRCWVRSRSGNSCFGMKPNWK